MPVRKQRRRRPGCETLAPLPAVEEGPFQEVKTGVLLLPSERVETSPRRLTTSCCGMAALSRDKVCVHLRPWSVVRRFVVSCWGDADAIFARL